MTNPQTETKIELVTEGIEALVLASVVAHAAHPGAQRALFHENVVSARADLHAALKALMQPTLRVVAATETVKQVGAISLTERTVKSELAEVVPYGGKGIDGMNLA